MFPVNTRRRTQSISIPAPVGGLNDRDSIADMPETDAIQLDNWFPGTTSVSVRGGCVQFATGLSQTGESLMAYNGFYGGSSVKKLFAAAGGNIYDATAGGSLTAIATGMTNARWDYCNFSNSGAAYLVAVNGANLPQFYNGNTWTASGSGYATAITGLPTGAVLSQVSVWKKRLFFVQKNSLSCWYLAAGAIGGAAQQLDFSGVAKLGGYLIATYTSTSTAGFSLDDYFVALTSEGEVLIYGGTDPSNASTFALIGNYRLGRPIANGSDNMGGRWLTKYASDIVAITASGLSTLQAVMNDDVMAQQSTINRKITNSVTNVVTSYASNFGWQALVCPMQNKLIINVPTSPDNTQSFQFVMNTITGAWTKFIGWNATCFEYFSDTIYAIIGTAIYQMDIPSANDFVTGTSSGNPIIANAKSAFIYAGGREQNKSFKMARPMLITKQGIVPYFNINVNLRDDAITGAADVHPGIGNQMVWGQSTWGGANWGNDNIQYLNWLTVNGIGYCAAIKLQVQCQANTCKWQGWELQYETGGLI